MCGHCFRLEKAYFDEFTWRDPDGHIRFANRHLPRTGRFCDRVWPIFWREKRRPRRRPRGIYWGHACSWKMTRSIERAANVSAARRWIPTNPLEAHAERVEDAARVRRGLR